MEQIDRDLENALDTRLQKLYFNYIKAKILEAKRNVLTGRLTINIRQGTIESISESNVIAGSTVASYYLNK